MAIETTKKTSRRLNRYLTEGSGQSSESSFVDAGVELAGQVAGAITADRQHAGQAQGQAIGGGIGAAAGALFGPMGAMLGGKLGSLAGGLIGGASDKKRAIADSTESLRKTNMSVDLTANVNPYGQFAEGGLVEGPIEEDPAKPLPSVVDKVTADARSFALRRGLLSGEATHTGGVVPKVTLNGKEIPYGAPILEPTKQFKPVPRSATEFQYDGTSAWYIDPTSGDMVDMDPVNINLPQFRKPAPRMEEGGMTGGMSMDGEAMNREAMPRRINIERGELLSDKEGNILEKYINPHRYHPHADSAFEEPMGNFVDAPADAVVVPKRLAKRFEKGDVLTRRSIMRKLVDQQVQDPTINDPQFADGGYTGQPYPTRKPVTEVPDYGAYMQTELDAQNRPVVQRVTNIADPTPTITPRVTPPTDITGPSIPYVQPDAPAKGQPKSGTDWGMVGRRVGSKLPSVFQGITALQGDPLLRKEYNHGFDEARANLMQIDDTYNVNDQLAAIEQNTALALDAIGQNNTPSARAEAAAIVAKANEAKGQVLAQQQRARSSVRNNKLAQLANLDVQEGASNQGEDVRYQTERRMNAANDNNIMANVLSEQYRMDAGWQNDMEKIKMINAMSKFEDINPLDVAKFTGDPAAVDYIYSQLAASRPLKEILADLQASRTAAANTTSSRNTSKKS